MLFVCGADAADCVANGPFSEGFNILMRATAPGSGGRGRGIGGGGRRGGAGLILPNTLTEFTRWDFVYFFAKYGFHSETFVNSRLKSKAPVKIHFCIHFQCKV